MPPSPIVKAVVDPVSFLRLMDELPEILAPPKVRFLEVAAGERCYGVCQFGTPCRITMHMGLAEYDSNSLRFVAAELSKTLLHEIRHAWQYDHHGAKWLTDQDNLPYAHRPGEIDAEEFAEAKIAEYRLLVRVRRSFPSSPFSRLSKTQATIRQSV